MLVAIGQKLIYVDITGHISNKMHKPGNYYSEAKINDSELKCFTVDSEYVPKGFRQLTSDETTEAKEKSFAMIIMERVHDHHLVFMRIGLTRKNTEKGVNLHLTTLGQTIKKPDSPKSEVGIKKWFVSVNTTPAGTNFSLAVVLRDDYRIDFYHNFKLLESDSEEEFIDIDYDFNYVYLRQKTDRAFYRIKTSWQSQIGMSVAKAVPYLSQVID